MKYYLTLALGFLGIFIPIPIAMDIARTMGSYWYGALFLLIVALIVLMLYRRYKQFKGVFWVAASTWTATGIVMLGMTYAGFTGISPQ